MGTDGRVTVVGIGADGWDGLGTSAREAVQRAEVVLGGSRQLALLPDDPRIPPRRPWPTPMTPALPGLFDELADRAVCVLASGDPMFFGIGATLARLLSPERLRVLPAPSSVALACARLGWPAEEVDVVSVVGRPLARVRRALAPGRRVIVLSSGAESPGEIAALLDADGWGPSAIALLEQLGGPGERLLAGLASDWPHPPGDALNLVAVSCEPGPDARVLGEVPGLPDEAYDHDGQLTKREVRAVTVAMLAPRAGELLWDVGAGAGSIAIEWMRAHSACRAVAVESHLDRVAAISRNADALGVPGLRVVPGRAPAALTDLPTPDAVFIGGGVTGEGVLDACLDALRPGGRLVANAVTVEGEAVLAAAHARLGGTLTRLSVARAGAVGGFTGWRPAMPVTIWSVTP
ncbi:precorrin-6y C5,15-methyltransferase (decarboxylating) subunit CbiE [Pseudonocardia benzenivorans]|uniref:Precorrin-6y C5,15-methyltransferase (Decarboxylating) subunit CbiE n=3 Tax=Pseudonocardia TaxID=1847 RepID=A0ABW3VM39_9PSEU